MPLALGSTRSANEAVVMAPSSASCGQGIRGIAATQSAAQHPNCLASGNRHLQTLPGIYTLVPTSINDLTGGGREGSYTSAHGFLRPAHNMHRRAGMWEGSSGGHVRGQVSSHFCPHALAACDRVDGGQ